MFATAIVTSLIVSAVLVFLMMTVIIPRIRDVIQDDKELRRAEKDDIKTDLSNKKEAIEKLVRQLHEELKTSSDDLEKAERERIGSFHALKKELENQQKITDRLSTTTENLNKLLSNNQLRGQFGEKVAEDLLKMSGFVKGVDYDFNKTLSDGQSRPDFTIYLPNKVKINVDSKFPYQNLQKLAESTDEATRKDRLKAFEHDVKEKIKQVVTRNYINPQDNTVDFVILFIPNEMIFSFIYDKMNSLWTDGMKQKVVFAGPFSFTAILRLVRQAYDNFRYQNNVQKIITQIKEFELEFAKYNEEFMKIGDRIHSLSDQYALVNQTRTNKLLKSIDKINQEDTVPAGLFEKKEESI